MRKIFFLLVLAVSRPLVAQMLNSPLVKEGDGPFTQLIIRGVTLINGTGAPPMGPVDIVVKQNRIVEIKNVGYPGVPIKDDRRPKLEPGGKELDCTGMYLMPGFIDMHAHIGGDQAPIAEYVFKLWMAHGITTIDVEMMDNSQLNFITLHSSGCGGVDHIPTSGYDYYNY